VYFINLVHHVYTYLPFATINCFHRVCTYLPFVDNEERVTSSTFTYNVFTFMEKVLK